MYKFGLIALILAQSSMATENTNAAKVTSVLRAASDLSFQGDAYNADPGSKIAIERAKIEMEANAIDLGSINLPAALKEWNQKEELEAKNREGEGDPNLPYYFSTIPNAFVSSATGDMWINYLEKNLDEKRKSCGLRSYFFMGAECRKLLEEGPMIENNLLLIAAKNIGVIPKEINYKTDSLDAAWADKMFKRDKVFSTQQKEKFKNILFDLYKDITVENLGNYKNSSPHPISALQGAIAMGDSRAIEVANKFLSDFSKKKSAHYDINSDPDAQHIFTILSGYNMFFTSATFDSLKKAEVAAELKDPVRKLYDLKIDYLNNTYKFSQFSVEKFIQSADLVKKNTRQHSEPPTKPVAPENPTKAE